jgi:hypothetical protein
VVLAHLARRVGDDLVTVFERDAKARIGQHFRHYAVHVDEFFLGHGRSPVKFDAPDVRAQSVGGRTEQHPQAYWPAGGGRRGSAGCLRQTRRGSPQGVWRADRMNEVDGLKGGMNPSLPCLAVPGGA